MQYLLLPRYLTNKTSDVPTQIFYDKSTVSLCKNLCKKKCAVCTGLNSLYSITLQEWCGFIVVPGL